MPRAYLRRVGMKKRHHLGLIIPIIACVLIACGSILWTARLMNALFAYRSPLHANPPEPGAPLGAPLTRRVVFVLVDALRADTAWQSEVMPFLNQLRQQAAWATMHSQPPSYSQPGYSTLLTGAWPDINDGPVLNLDYESIPTWTQDNIFSACQRAGLQTAISGYYWFEKLIPQAAVSASFYTHDDEQVADRQVLDAALPWLRDGSYPFVLIHIDQVDYAGHHEGGPRDPRWDAAARRADGLIQEIASTLDFSRDTLLVVSDHGQIDRGGHGGTEQVVLIEPFVLVGAGVRPGNYGNVNMVDITPTLAALLGVNIPASSQGQVLTNMLTLGSSQLQVIQQAQKVQQSQMFAAYQKAIGSNSIVKVGEESVPDYQQALEAARMARLNAERWPRALLAIILAFLPIGYAIRRVIVYRSAAQKARLPNGLHIDTGRIQDNPSQQSVPVYIPGFDIKRLALLLAGGLVYLILFNGRYAILDDRVYSFSSLTGYELVAYLIVTVLIALLFGGLVPLLGMRSWRGDSYCAAGLVLEYVLAIIYLLALPVMFNFAFNGFVARWTLPDFPSMFVGFLSLFQIALVAVLGLLLAGMFALIVGFLTPKGRVLPA